MLARTAVGVSARAVKYAVCVVPRTAYAVPHTRTHTRAGMVSQPTRSFAMHFKPRGYVGSIAQYRGRVDHMRDYYDSLTVVIYLTNGDRVVYTFNNVKEHFIFVDKIVEELDIEIKRDVEDKQQNEKSALMHIYAPFMDDVDDADADADDTYNDREDSASRYFKTWIDSVYSDDADDYGDCDDGSE